MRFSIVRTERDGAVQVLERAAQIPFLAESKAQRILRFGIS